MYWFAGKHAKLSADNKLLIYKTIIKTHLGVRYRALWGMVAKSHAAKLEALQATYCAQAGPW